MQRRCYFTQFALAMGILGWCGVAHAATTRYTFSTPPDDMFFTIAPNPLNTGFPAWPSQVADTRDLVEHRAGVVIENELNAPLSFSNTATADILLQSSLLSGDFAWSKPLQVGHDPFIIFDFTNRDGGPPKQVSFDFAISVPLTSYSIVAFDSEGDSATLTGPVSPFSFNGGVNNGAEGHITLTPTGQLNNLAKIQIGLPGLTQVGLDNITFDSSVDADFTGDGFVDGQDLIAWATAFGSGNGGDADGDNDADGKDFLIWQKEYTGPPALTASLVPEPTSYLLCLIAIAAFTPFASCRLVSASLADALNS